MTMPLRLALLLALLIEFLPPKRVSSIFQEILQAP